MTNTIINHPVIRITLMFLLMIGSMPIFKWVIQAGGTLKHNHPGDGMALIIDAMLFCAVLFYIGRLFIITGKPK